MIRQSCAGDLHLVEATLLSECQLDLSRRNTVTSSVRGWRDAMVGTAQALQDVTVSCVRLYRVQALMAVQRTGRTHLGAVVSSLLVDGRPLPHLQAHPGLPRGSYYQMSAA
jgi:hypothetical protein